MFLHSDFLVSIKQLVRNWKKKKKQTYAYIADIKKNQTLCAYFARPVVVIYKLPPYDIASRPYKNFIAGCISNIPGLAVTAMQMCLSVQAQFYFVRSRESRRERRAPPLPPLTRNVANGNSISSNPLESLRSAFRRRPSCFRIPTRRPFLR